MLRKLLINQAESSSPAALDVRNEPCHALHELARGAREPWTDARRVGSGLQTGVPRFVAPQQQGDTTCPGLANRSSSRPPLVRWLCFPCLPSGRCPRQMPSSPTPPAIRLRPPADRRTTTPTETSALTSPASPARASPTSTPSSAAPS